MLFSKMLCLTMCSEMIQKQTRGEKRGNANRRRQRDTTTPQEKRRKRNENTSGDFPHVPMNHCRLFIPQFSSTRSLQIRFTESYAAAAAAAARAATPPPACLNTEPQVWLYSRRAAAPHVRRCHDGRRYETELRAWRSQRKICSLSLSVCQTLEERELL